uniref:R-spondin Fu-CRD domain-containing protein n=1 Tax=Periophthalmus magnuspinnatus TaxID=409849 RepID=A0A3B4A7U3_9GOBI
AFSLLLSVMVSSSTTSSSTAGRLCPTGCVTCSALNGCLSCKSRLFFHLEVDGMRQRGVCLSSCPRGHYGTRSPYINTCTRCKEDCASCFSESFCTRCHSDRFLFRGKCERSCPFGLTANLELRECIGTLHCEVGEWSDWSPCVHKRTLRFMTSVPPVRPTTLLGHPVTRLHTPTPTLEETFSQLLISSPEEDVEDDSSSSSEEEADRARGRAPSLRQRRHRQRPLSENQPPRLPPRGAPPIATPVRSRSPDGQCTVTEV